MMLERVLRSRVFRWPSLLVASIVHLVWGVGVVVDPAALAITALTPLNEFYAPAAGLFLILFAYLGLWSITRPLPSWLTLMALLPQQMLLVLSATSAIYFTSLGQFGDGVPRSHAFIGLDQCLIVLLAAFHAVVIVEMHLDHVFPRRKTGEQPEKKLPPAEHGLAEE